MAWEKRVLMLVLGLDPQLQLWRVRVQGRGQGR